MNKLSLSTLFFLVIIFNSEAQSILFKNLDKNNPFKKGDTSTFEKKIQIHTKFLEEAKNNSNDSLQFYANLYLFDDYYHRNEYVLAKKYLFEAELIALKKDFPSWLAEIQYRKGYLSNDLFEQIDSSIKYFKKSIEYCTKAKDSLCIAESLEQIASLYTQNEDFELAHQYFDKAIPIINKYANRNQYDYVYNNISNLLSAEGNYPKAILYIDTAILLAKESNDLRHQSSYIGNKASYLRKMGQNDVAISMLKELININEKNGWRDKKAGNLYNIILALKAKGDYKQACEYDLTFFALRDSLIGEDVKLKEAELDAKYETQKKELLLTKAEYKLERISWILAILVLLGLVALWLWFRNMNSKRKELDTHKHNLADVTKLLLKKNQQLADFENELNTGKNIPISIEKSDENNSEYQNDEEYNFLNASILTPDDWNTFKQYFEKAYPGYLFKLRNAYPTISESEERLFTFIKLNIKSKEAAGILGISAESVKKTRTRLRKRLNLAEDVDLTTFIHEF